MQKQEPIKERGMRGNFYSDSYWNLVYRRSSNTSEVVAASATLFNY